MGRWEALSFVLSQGWGHRSITVFSRLKYHGQHKGPAQLGPETNTRWLLLTFSRFIPWLAEKVAEETPRRRS